MAEHLGMAELSRRLGVSRQRVHQLRRTYKDFPEPVAQLACGDVWHLVDVDEWLHAHAVRPTGRRLRSPTASS